jgi:biopolymer transport protein ExbB
LAATSATSSASAQETGKPSGNERQTAAAGPSAQPTAQPAEVGKKSTLGWLYDALGKTYAAIFLGLSFALVALAVINALALRREAVVPADLVQAFAALCRDHRYPEACDLARRDESFLGRMLAAGAAEISGGSQAAARAMQQIGDAGSLKLQQQIGYLTLIAQLSPLFGLLGTVDALVRTLESIAAQGLAPRLADLAPALGTALVATLVGLWIAIPAIALGHVFRGRLDRLMLQSGAIAENLIGRFAAVPPKPPRD